VSWPLTCARWAYAAYEEQDRGSLEVGEFADIAVVDRDPCALPPADVAGVTTFMTFVGGELRYCADPVPFAEVSEKAAALTTT
jgi:predicted amidohydrolase YtcJ